MHILRVAPEGRIAKDHVVGTERWEAVYHQQVLLLWLGRGGDGGHHAHAEEVVGACGCGVGKVLMLLMVGFEFHGAAGKLLL